MMITIREIDDKDYKRVNRILMEEQIKEGISQGLIYILIEEDEYAGIGKIDVENGYGVLKYIFVREKYRGFNYGEALLRAMLFKLNVMDINVVFYREYNKYLINKGFELNKKNLIVHYSLSLSINSFFKDCCLCGDNDEI